MTSGHFSQALSLDCAFQFGKADNRDLSCRALRKIRVLTSVAQGETPHLAESHFDAS